MPPTPFKNSEKEHPLCNPLDAALHSFLRSQPCCQDQELRWWQLSTTRQERFLADEANHHCWPPWQIHSQKHINYLSQMIFFSSKAPTQSHKPYTAPQCDCGGWNMALGTRSHLNIGPYIHLFSLNAFSNGDYKDRSSPHFLLFSIWLGKSPTPCYIFLRCLLCCSWHLFSPFPSPIFSSFWCLLACIFCIF